MPFTSQGRNSRAFEKLARELEPDAAFRRQRSVELAIGSDGKVRPGAIPPGTVHLSDSVFVASGGNNASTTNWVTAAFLIFTPPVGRWKVRANAFTRIGNSGSSSVDAQLLINAQVVCTDTKTGPSSGANPMNLTGSRVDILGGEQVLVQVQFKSDSTGTSTMTNIVLEYFADRL